MLDVDAPWSAFWLQDHRDSLHSREVVLDRLRSFQVRLSMLQRSVEEQKTARQEYPEMIPVIRDAAVKSRQCDAEGWSLFEAFWSCVGCCMVLLGLLGAWFQAKGWRLNR